jgi:hypothetical protein
MSIVDGLGDSWSPAGSTHGYMGFVRDADQFLWLSDPRVVADAFSPNPGSFPPTVSEIAEKRALAKVGSGENPPALPGFGMSSRSAPPPSPVKAKGVKIGFWDKETEERMTAPGYAGPCAYNTAILNESNYALKDGKYVIDNSKHRFKYRPPGPHANPKPDE